MPAKEINLGVLLDEDDNLGDLIASDTSLNYYIRPKDVNQMLRYFKELADKGVKIKKLVLVGHGSEDSHSIGILKPDDVNLNKIKDDRDFRYRRKNELQKLIAAETNPDKRAELESMLATVSNNYNDHTFKEKIYADIEDLMTPDAVIGFLNCYAASDKSGEAFMKDLGDALLKKNGGRVVGNTGAIAYSDLLGLVSYIRDQDQFIVWPLGRWLEQKITSTGTSQKRCGEPCKDFEKYGFCDRKTSGGPCWDHGGN